MDLRTYARENIALSVEDTENSLPRDGAADVDAIICELEERQLLALTRQVALRHHVRVKDILGKGRRATEARARRELWSLIYAQVPSLSWVGRLFRRDRSTILAGLRKQKEEHPM